MGNCCKTTSSSMEWGGEDWSSLAVPEERKKINKKKSSRKVFDLISASSSSSSCLEEQGKGRIKIRMTKKEFQVLLGEIEKQKQKQKQKQQGKVLSGEAVLESLLIMKARGDHHKPWTPVLDTISEL